MATTELTDNERALLAREVAADDYDRQWPLRTTLGNTAREGFCAGWDAAMEYVKQQSPLTEDYYTLAEVRLVTDMTIVEYGSCDARLAGIAELIDKKRPELKPYGQS